MSTSARPRRAVEAKREAYRQVVLDCAEALFAAGGVDGTRVEAIAQAAGLAPRTLYSVFASKDELVNAVSERRRTELFEQAAERSRLAESPFAAVRASAVAATEYFCAHVDYLRLELHEARAWSDERSSRSVTWYLAIEAFTTLFARCIADGSVRPGEPAAYAHALIALQQSQLSHWVATGASSPPADVVAAIDELVVRSFASDATLSIHLINPEQAPRSPR